MWLAGGPAQHPTDSRALPPRLQAAAGGGGRGVGGAAGAPAGAAPARAHLLPVGHRLGGCAHSKRQVGWGQAWRWGSTQEGTRGWAKRPRSISLMPLAKAHCCRNLDAALPPELRLDWRQRCRAAPPPPGSIANLFQRKAAAAAAEGSSQGAEQGCSGGSREQAPGAAEGSKSAGATRLVPSGKRAREGSGAGEAVGRKSGGGSGGGILRFLQRPPAG